MSLRQSTVAAFHSRRGALKSLDLLCGPRLPIREDMRGEPLGDGVLVKRGAPLCPSSLHLDFPPCAARVSYLMFPIDPWKQRLPRPLPPWRGDGRLRGYPRNAGHSVASIPYREVLLALTRPW